MFYQPGIDDHGLPHDPFKVCWRISRKTRWQHCLLGHGGRFMALYAHYLASFISLLNLLFISKSTIPTNLL